MMHLRLMLLALLLTACSTHSVIQESRAFARRDDHLHAYEVLDIERARQQAGGGEVDPELEAEHAAAYRRMLRARARQHIFQEREDRALGDLAELEAIAPDFPGLRELRERALLKKAQRACTRGEESLLRKEYADALAHFLESERVAPGLEAAVEGIAKVQEHAAAMSARAQQQFLEAVRKLPEFRYVEVQWHAANVLHNAPERDEAKDLQGKAQRQNAERALARGAANEQQDRFGAALMEYRAARQLDPTLPGIDEKLATLEREMQVAGMIDKAQIDMRSGRFDVAREQLQRAYELSTLARGHVSELMIQAKQLEGVARYRAARDLEVLGHKSEALAAFEALAVQWPDGVEDESARIVSLRVDIAGAQSEWAAAEAAEAAGELAKALEHFRAVQRYYAGWPEIADRIARVQAAIARQAEGSGGEGSGGQGSGGEGAR